jgi:hypothetical protein
MNGVYEIAILAILYLGLFLGFNLLLGLESEDKQVLGKIFNRLQRFLPKAGGSRSKL